MLADIYLILKLNAGVTTQLLLTLFRIEGVVHYGIAGNANPNLQIGDVTIPRYWAHAGLWNWQVITNYHTNSQPYSSSPSHNSLTLVYYMNHGAC